MLFKKFKNLGKIDITINLQKFYFSFKYKNMNDQLENILVNITFKNNVGEAYMRPLQPNFNKNS